MNRFKQPIQSSISLIIFTITLLCTSTIIAAATSQDTPQENAGHNQQWNLKDVDIRILIEQIAKLTGKSFIIDPAVKGKVTIITNRSLSPEESYQAFLTVLEVYDFAAIENGRVTTIVPQNNASAQTSYGNSHDNTSPPNLDSIIVKVIHVNYVPTDVLADAIRPLTSSKSVIQSIKNTNDLIVADYSNNVVKISNLIKSIDRADIGNNYEVVKLQYAEPSEINTILTSIVTGSNDNAQAIKIAADERTNSILISGTLDQRLKIRALIASMDKPTKDIDNDTQVIYLRYVQAKDIAPIVANIIQDYEAKLQKKTGIKESVDTTQIAANKISQQISSSGSMTASNFGAGSSQESGGGTSLSSYTNQAANLARQEENRQRSGAVSTSVQWEETTNSIIVRAPKDLLRNIKNVITKLDIRRMQVLIEVIIAEVSEARAQELGVEWNTNGNDVRLSTRFPSTDLSTIHGPMGGNGASILSSTTSSSTSAFIPGQGLTLGFFHVDNLRAIVRALATDTGSDILSTPNIVTLDNETATIKVGELVPFAIGESTNNINNGGTPFTSFQREEVGLSLTIRPQITPSGEVMLHIDHIISDIVPGTQITNSSGNPTTTERVITTNVIVDNHEVLVLGGLIQKKYQNEVDKVPVLGNLPVVGGFFRSTSKSNQKLNLMIFLKPNILMDKKSNVLVSGDRYEEIRKTQLDLKNDLRKRYISTTPTLAKLDEVSLPKPFFIVLEGNSLQKPFAATKENYGE